MRSSFVHFVSENYPLILIGLGFIFLISFVALLFSFVKGRSRKFNRGDQELERYILTILENTQAIRSKLFENNLQAQVVNPSETQEEGPKEAHKPLQPPQQPAVQDEELTQKVKELEFLEKKLGDLVKFKDENTELKSKLRRLEDVLGTGSMAQGEESRPPQAPSPEPAPKKAFVEETKKVSRSLTDEEKQELLSEFEKMLG